MQTDRNIIDVDDDIREDNRPQEVPVITIEETQDNSSPYPYKSQIFTRENVKGRKNRRCISVAVVVLCLSIVGLLLWQNRYYLMTPEVVSSVSDNKNIEILKSTAPASTSGTTITTDSLLGVAFDMYSLSGLKASLEREMPDTTDSSLVLFMRSADYHPDGSMLGTVMLDGEEFPSKERKSRPAYMAISKAGVPTIGISLTDKVSDFIKNNKGDFFRQYVLLGDGELPSSFALHGKVERAAIGRMADGQLFYIVSRHKETMYDFADALREYGFTDAIYITGGNGYSFYRTTDGETHINAETKEKIKKYSKASPPAPLLVFRIAD
ncbi:MAG: phosphodiester glycosidase family protein [Muribaculaceae bacterium]|nr:phosphodiester glycosidase family protein [Muribaculaceae bacterium]